MKIASPSVAPTLAPETTKKTISFDELGLSPRLLSALAALGFEHPTSIQEKTLPILLGEPTDFLGLAATGTGKTGAFAIPMLERLDPSVRAVQAIILCPTRELAMQVAQQVTLMGKDLGVRALPVYGGASFGDQKHGLKQGAQVVVGTPGRVIDHLERGSLNLDSVTTVVLDEADEMISMGFKEEIEAILDRTPREESNIWLFSATMSPDVRRVADTYLRNPKQVRSNDSQMLNSKVEQIYYMTQESNKPEVLCKLIDAADGFFGLIFCQTKATVIDLTRFLNERGYSADCLHGDMDQRAREHAMHRFREHKIKILVCTDVASRGLDVKDISHVINFSIPRELDSYVHRIGRTARSGKAGIAMSLATPSHRGLIRRIEQITKSKMIEGKIPTRKDIAVKKISSILAKLQEQDTYPRVIELLDGPWKQALAGMTSEEIAGRFLALSFPELFTNDREKADEVRQLHKAPALRSHGSASSEAPARAPRRAYDGGEPRSRVMHHTPMPAPNGTRVSFSPSGEARVNASPVGSAGSSGYAAKSGKPFGARKPYEAHAPRRPHTADGPRVGDKRPFKKPFKKFGKRADF